jgi:hypothetical protein
MAAVSGRGKGLASETPLIPPLLFGPTPARVFWGYHVDSAAWDRRRRERIGDLPALPPGVPTGLAEPLLARRASVDQGKRRDEIPGRRVRPSVVQAPARFAGLERGCTDRRLGAAIP